MSHNNIDERRSFSRIPFETTAHLKSESDDLYLHCPVIDISLKGLLITKPENWLGDMGDTYHVDLLLENAQLIIKMQVSVAHIDAVSIGLQCEHIDLDSISHLKRLVELNLGDEDLLHRELSALID